MTSWKGTWVRSRIEEEEHLRPPNADEVRAKATRFRRIWSKVLGLHWAAYFVLFLSQFALGSSFNMSLVMVGFFSLFINQAAYIMSAAGFDRFIAKRLGKIREQRTVRVLESGDATVTLDDAALSVRFDAASARETERTPVVGEAPRSAPELDDVRISLDEGAVVFDWVRDADGQAVLEVRHTRAALRIDLGGFERSLPDDAPLVDRDPVVLSARDAAELAERIDTLRAAWG